MTPKKWVPIEATIFSADYVNPGGEERPCWRVTYSFRVDDAYYSGEFIDFATDADAEYRKDERVSIEYLASNPNKSRFPGVTTYWSKARIPFAIGGALGLAVVVLYVLSHR